MEKAYTVLIVDDNLQNIQVIANTVEECGCEAGFAQNGEQALEFLSVIKPALILLDVMMPIMDGFELCKIIKQTPNLQDIPVIFITAKNEKDDIIRGFEVGGVDYISKPFNTAELKMRIKNHLEITKHRKELEEANNQLEVLNQKLNIANKELEKTASTDQLTGAWNRRYFFGAATAEMERAKRYKQTMSLFLLDIDHFKDVNDSFGHQMGDKVLVDFADLIHSNIRNIDSLTRWGGEEFMILTPHLDIDEAIQLAERLRTVIECHDFNDAGTVTVSIGVAEFNYNDNLDTWIRRADEALYKAKENGRNRVAFI